MVKSLVLKFVCLLIALLVFVPNLTACVATTGNSTPLLPSDFENTPVPDVNLGGYIYLNQGTSITIPTDLLPTNSNPISIKSAQLWLGPDVNSVGGAVSFESQADAQVVSQLIKSYKDPVWSLANSNIIYAANNDSGQWTASLKNAVTQQQMVSVASKYPEVASDFAYFPNDPPSNPFAAGFIDLNSNLIESISTSLGLSLTNYTSALESAKISRVCFVIYSAQSLKVSSETITEDYINSLQLGVLALGRSTYPDIALSLFFDEAMGNAGFTKYSVDDVDLYKYSVEGVKLLAAHKGNVIYAAASQSEGLAEKLLLSCF